MKLLYFFLGFVFGLLFGRFVLTEPPAQPAQSGLPVRPVAKTVRDDLTQINGIGPAFAKSLEAIGIQSFAALAQADADTLAARLSGRVTADRIRRDQWIEQARTLSQH